MTPLEREIARRACTGACQSEIASDLGIHRHTVQRTLQRAEVRAHIASIQDAIDQELVRAMVYNPFVDILADSANQKRRRRSRL